MIFGKSKDVYTSLHANFCNRNLIGRNCHGLMLWTVCFPRNDIGVTGNIFWPIDTIEIWVYTNFVIFEIVVLLHVLKLSNILLNNITFVLFGRLHPLHQSPLQKKEGKEKKSRHSCASCFRRAEGNSAADWPAISPFPPFYQLFPAVVIPRMILKLQFPFLERI